MTRLIDLQSAYDYKRGERVGRDDPRVRFARGFHNGTSAERAGG